MAPARDPAFLPEVWALYSAGAAWLVLRLFVRIRMMGLVGLDLADALAVVALAAWTYTAAVVEITYYDGTNTDYTMEEIVTFDQPMRDQLEYGSKLFFGSWYAYIALVFSLKGIVIVLYRKFLVEEWQRIVFYITTFMCVAGFTGISLAISLICLPIHKRWQVYPPPPPTCTASSSVLISLACINAVTDVLLLSIPVPLLWTLRISLMKRIGVFILLASGIFVLGACILRVSLTAIPGTSVLVIARWGIREIFVAIVTVNAAAIRPIFRISFWTSSASNWRRNPLSQPAHRAVHCPHRQSFPRRVVGFDPRARRNPILDSPSAGISTLHAWNEPELGNAESVHGSFNNTVHPSTISSSDRSIQTAKQQRNEKQKGQHSNKRNDACSSFIGDSRRGSHGRLFFNALLSFGRSDLGSGWTGRRNAGNTASRASDDHGPVGFNYAEQVSLGERPAEKLAIESSCRNTR